jgi:hypothetical protein
VIERFEMKSTYQVVIQKAAFLVIGSFTFIGLQSFGQEQSSLETLKVNQYVLDLAETQTKTFSLSDFGCILSRL